MSTLDSSYSPWTGDGMAALAAVLSIVRVVEMTGLPNTQAMVLGVIDGEGRIIRVVDTRKRFRVAPREIDLSDELSLDIRLDSRQWAISSRGFNGTTANKVPVLLDDRMSSLRIKV